MKKSIKEVISLINTFVKTSKVGESSEGFLAEDGLGLEYYLTHIEQGGNDAVVVHEECAGLWTRALLIPINGENDEEEMAEALEWYFDN